MITLQEIINSLGSLSKEDQDFLFEILRTRREEETKQVAMISQVRNKQRFLWKIEKMNIVLVEKVQHSRLTEHQKTQNIESLKQDIVAGSQQLENGEYTEYDENNLSTLITSIKSASLSSSKFC
jgi:hypothetical protein